MQGIFYVIIVSVATYFLSSLFFTSQIREYPSPRILLPFPLNCYSILCLDQSVLTKLANL